ncbi:MAG TPA: diaminopimelate decarboxylase [Fibrobacteres bacterium]|jgi:diaminopimelate decarboxylase|nr:diaminopimelate decarboxylase [Fibrobacterota bacterium]
MQNILTRFAGSSIVELAQRHGTPFFLYDQQIIEQRVAELKQFDAIRYAQKACSNLAILALMRKLGVVVDAVSAGEIERALRAGYRPAGDPPGIVFTADLFDADAVEAIRTHRIPVNVGSPDMIAQLGKFFPGAQVTLRINPGFGHGHSRKTNTGGEWSKHGIWHEQLEECLKLGHEAGVNIHGLHMHIGSGTDFEHLSQVCDSMVRAARRMGPQLEVISAGGGLPIPYRKNQARIDLNAYFQLWDKARKEVEHIVGHPVRLEVEPGRYLVAESCALVVQIRSIKKTGNNSFYLVDAGFDTLVRPSMYGSYHEISICPADGREITSAHDVVVAGPLCESGDVFTQEEGGVVVTRKLPEAKVGDYLVLHDSGAYGAAMSSNYNTRRLATEILGSNGQAEVIRERQTYDHILQFERIPEKLR